MNRAYPFVPKSTSFLEQGQFWALPLNDGCFSSGVVLSLVCSNGKIETRSFLAGLLGWHGHAPPATSDLLNCKVLAYGYAHIKTITETGGSILGVAESNFCLPEVQEYADSIVTWGYHSIVRKAERAFAAS